MKHENFNYPSDLHGDLGVRKSRHIRGKMHKLCWWVTSVTWMRRESCLWKEAGNSLIN